MVVPADWLAGRLDLAWGVVLWERANSGKIDISERKCCSQNREPGSEGVMISIMSIQKERTDGRSHQSETMIKLGCVRLSRGITIATSEARVRMT